MRMLAILLALIISGCASTAKLMEANAAYNCAAYLRGIEPIGPVPTLVWRNDYWLVYGLLVRGTYNPSTNVVTVTRELNSYETIVHEMDHAIKSHLGEKPNEPEAQQAGDSARDCLD